MKNLIHLFRSNKKKSTLPLSHGQENQVHRFLDQTVRSLGFEKLSLEERIYWSKDEHHWICEDLVNLKFFIQFFSLMPQHVREYCFRTPIIFIPLQGPFALSYSAGQRQGSVLLMPELISLMRKSQRCLAMAILAHELGHFFLGHHNKEIEKWRAQCEADDFAIQLGLGEDLKTLLKDLSYQYDECALRYKRLQTIDLLQHLKFGGP